VKAPVVRAVHLSRWYGDVIGLNDISVDVEPGITGLLGPNGAGKSSFLRIVSGELRPSYGAVEVLDEVPFANPRLHRRIGYCPEGDRFFDDMRSGDFVVHLLRLSGYAPAAARERGAWALAEVGMERAARTRLGACSKGMRQRVKLAQAIAHDPELLLLDEPLSGLDPVARHETQEMIRRRAAAGASVLVSSHVLHEVESLTSRILLINKGRIAATGEVEEIRTLIDRHPHRIRVECEAPRRLAALLVDREDLRSFRFEDAALWVETTDPDAFYGSLPALVVEEEIPVTGISSPDDRLQAVFDILVS
jgi:ABC-2 type transport system ATP-binding protein